MRLPVFLCIRLLPGMAVLLLAALLLAPCPGIAAPAQVPGSRIVLDLPDGFAATRDFSGFVNVTDGSSILLLDVPASAYPEMAKGLSPDALSRKGVNNVQTGTLERSGEYIFITGEQPTASGPYAKYVLLFREPAATALVSISVPRSSIESGSAEPHTFEQILSSARIDPKAGEKPFVLGYSGPFRDTRAFVGQSYFYAIEGRPAQKNGAAAGKQPSLVVAASLDGPLIDDLEASGRAGIAALSGGREPQNVESRPLQVAGLDGIEQVAPPSGTGTETGIYQVILRRKDGGYYRIVGQAPSAEWPALLPQFRKIAQSFAPRPSRLDSPTGSLP